MTDNSPIDFEKAAQKHRHQKHQNEKEAKVADIKARFTQALPDKARPVKEYFNKKKAKKKS